MRSIAFLEGFLNNTSSYEILRFLWNTRYITLRSVITFYSQNTPMVVSMLVPRVIPGSASQ